MAMVINRNLFCLHDIKISEFPKAGLLVFELRARFVRILKLFLWQISIGILILKPVS
jgi:hypothetical protein